MTARLGGAASPAIYIDEDDENMHEMDVDQAKAAKPAMAARQQPGPSSTGFSTHQEITEKFAFDLSNELLDGASIGRQERARIQQLFNQYAYGERYMQRAGFAAFMADQGMSPRYTDAYFHAFNTSKPVRMPPCAAGVDLLCCANALARAGAGARDCARSLNF